MRTIAICAVQVPFVRGGAELLVDGLRTALLAHGYAVEVVTLPFKWYPARAVVDHALPWRLVDLTEANGQTIDLVIATKFPSYLVRHPNKVTWLVHQHRQAYDLWDSPYGDLQGAPDGTRVRELITEMDRSGLAESQRIYTISKNVAQRLHRYNGIEGIPLYPPPKDDGRHHAGEFGDYIFTAVRLESIKRLDLLLRAMAQLPPGLRCLIAGTGPDRARLEALAGELGVTDRVQFLGFVDDEKLIDLYANCRAAYYAPYDEDYGYVTVEAMKSGKPVITCPDAGGVLEFVDHGVTGWVAEADPSALAGELSRVWDRPDLCRAMGEAGRERVASINWNRTVEALVGP
ncbi:MAG: glycosyltransferase family 4 protein [Chloroflexi bacterium]|nr:glycosyltransferase family 4 protein [Chloroflexota bacterium]